MTEGELYPILAQHVQNSGGEHFTVGLEYEEADSSSYSNANRMI